MDMDTRDYFFRLMKASSPASKEYLLTSIFGYLEGMQGFTPEPITFLCAQIQNHTDVDMGIVR